MRKNAENLLTAWAPGTKMGVSGVPCRLVPNPQLKPSLSSGSFLARFYLANSRGCAGNFLRKPAFLGGRISRYHLARSRIGARVTLRVLVVLCLAALVVGCSADNVGSPLEFFPGSQRTTWEDCGKFGGGGNDIQVCAAM